MKKRDKKNRQNAQNRGLLAELIAIIYMTLKGYSLLKWREKNSQGEVDLIFARAKTLVFVEVKARKTYDNALSAITYTQQRRIIAAAQYYCAHHGWSKKYICRFDAILILPRKLPVHLKDAFRTFDPRI